MAVRRNVRVLLAAVLIGVATAIGAVYFRGGSDSSAVPKYTVAPVTRGDMVRSIDTIGQLSPLTSVEVSTQISGLVTEVAVDFNTVVAKGQILAKIDPSTYEQRLRQAEADLEAARVGHEIAVLRARRLKTLLDQDLIPKQDYAEAEATLEQSRATLLTRRAVVENARVDLDRCILKSPIDGVVIFKQVEAGKTVISSLSAPTLFAIARDLSRMRIVAPVSEVDVALTHPNQSVLFTIDALGNRKFHGRLLQVRNPYTPADKQAAEPSQKNSIGSFDVIIEVDNSELALRPSFTANVSIVVEQRSAVLQIPNSALRVALGTPARVPSAGPLPTGTYAVVYRLPKGNRKAEPEAVRVSLGMTDNISSEILGGLKEGDTVITGIVAAADLRRHDGLFF